MQINVLSLAQTPSVEPLYEQLFAPTKLPGPLTMLADAVWEPVSMTPLMAFTVIVSVWFVLTALVAVAGVIWMLASSGPRLALPVASPVTVDQLQSSASVAGEQSVSGELLHFVLPLSEHVPSVPCKAPRPFMKNEPARAVCFTRMMAY